MEWLTDVDVEEDITRKWGIWTMIYLDKHGPAHRQELMDEIGVSNGTIYPLMDELEEGGYVRRFNTMVGKGRDKPKYDVSRKWERLKWELFPHQSVPYSASEKRIIEDIVMTKFGVGSIIEAEMIADFITFADVDDIRELLPKVLKNIDTMEFVPALEENGDAWAVKSRDGSDEWQGDRYVRGVE